MNRSSARGIAGRLTVAAVFLAFIAVAAGSLIGAHDPGFIYLFLIEAATILAAAIAVLFWILSLFLRRS